MKRLKAYPLPALSLAEATQLQWRLVDLIHQTFSGTEILGGGDLGVVPGLGRPETTAKVEQVLARFFGGEAAALVRGAGTGAIRVSLQVLSRPGQRILVHQAPIYTTTQVTLEGLGLVPVPVDFHDRAALEAAAQEADLALVQHTRQQLEDHYDYAEVVKALQGLPTVTDDNYAVAKVPALGVQYGATASTFSLFKLLGPEGVGCVVGTQALIDQIHRQNYSGGGQVQGPEALEALRALVYAPVALALQAQVVDEVARRLNAGEVPGVAEATVANAQSRVVLVRLEAPIAKEVLAITPKYGAAPHPVGAESRYEVAAMFYRASGTMLKAAPELAPYLIRINPMRAGADTVLRVLREALKEAQQCLS